MALFPAEIVARKAKCFSSSWWCVDREPAVLDEEGALVRHGRPKRFVLLAKGELNQLAYTGEVALHGIGAVSV